MRYAKITDGIVVQIQPNAQEGFVEVEDSIIVGMVGTGGDTYSIPAKTPEEIQAQAVSYFTAITTQFIHARVVAHNEANGTAFADIHNCESYSRATGYTHQVWCAKVFAWSVNIWEAVRAFQDSVQTLPTDEEFQAVLDSVEF